MAVLRPFEVIYRGRIPDLEELDYEAAYTIAPDARGCIINAPSLDALRAHFTDDSEQYAILSIAPARPGQYLDDTEGAVVVTSAGTLQYVRTYGRR